MARALLVWLAPATWVILALLGVVIVGVVLVGVAILGRLGRPNDQPSHHESLDQERSALQRERDALHERAQRLDERERRLESERDDLGQLKADLDDRLAALGVNETELAEARSQVAAAYESAAGLSREQAREELIAQVEVESATAVDQVRRAAEELARRSADHRAAEIITTAVQRLAVATTAESVVSTVELPNDDMKGRIIGREGRNIRAFEQLTGVDVLIDDTPRLVMLSCFDPVRREVARASLVDLVQDGRIHLASIEATVERQTAEVDERMRRAAQDALAEMQITDLDPHLVPILGALRFRTSFGQNVLAHLIECGHLAAMMAAELGLNVALCRRSAFLHDIGKALSHEAEGSHAMVGAQLARRYGESDEVVHAIEAHHNEVEPRTPVAVLTQAADAISASRPGARRQSVEAYVERLERLEEIAGRHPGVERVLAMQAGREVRVMVSPAEVDDAHAQQLAVDIARAVQDELTYPGEVKVTVVRELRASEVAR